MTDAPTIAAVAALNDADPCPRVSIIVEPGADNVAITVYRNTSAGQSVVRGAYGMAVSGAAVVRDYEAPAGADLTYTAIGYDADGTASDPSAASRSVQLTITGCPWVQDPLDPASATRWQLADWEAMTYERPAEVLYPLQSSTAVGIIGTRRDPTSEMTVYTKTDADAAALRQLCAVPVLLIRPDPSWGWAAAYWLVGDVDEARRYPKSAARPERLFTLPLTAVSGPAPDLASYLYTWAQVVEYYVSWSDLMASKSTWLDVLMNPAPGA